MTAREAAHAPVTLEERARWRGTTGERMSAARGSRTQTAVAARLSIGRTYLCHIEAGRRTLTVAILVKAADLFGVTTDFLLCRDSDMTRSLMEVVAQALSEFAGLPWDELTIEAQDTLSAIDKAGYVVLSREATEAEIEAMARAVAGVSATAEVGLSSRWKNSGCPSPAHFVDEYWVWYKDYVRAAHSALVKTND